MQELNDYSAVYCSLSLWWGLHRMKNWMYLSMQYLVEKSIIILIKFLHIYHSSNYVYAFDITWFPLKLSFIKMKLIMLFCVILILTYASP